MFQAGSVDQQEEMTSVASCIFGSKSIDFSRGEIFHAKVVINTIFDEGSDLSWCW